MFERFENSALALRDAIVISEKSRKKISANFIFFLFSGVLSAEKLFINVYKTEIYPPMNNCVYVTSRMVSQRCHGENARPRR